MKYHQKGARKFVTSNLMMKFHDQSPGAELLKQVDRVSIGALSVSGKGIEDTIRTFFIVLKTIVSSNYPDTPINNNGVETGYRESGWLPVLGKAGETGRNLTTEWGHERSSRMPRGHQAARSGKKRSILCINRDRLRLPHLPSPISPDAGKKMTMWGPPGKFKRSSPSPVQRLH